MEKLFTDAQLNWDLETLFTDLAAIKSYRLTEWEKTCLRGLLCGVDPEAIASHIFWTVSALRTELSRRIYPPVSILVNQKVGSWYRVAQFLARAGYKYPKLSILPEKLLCLPSLAAVSPLPNLIRSTEIVALLESHSPTRKIDCAMSSESEIEKIVRGDLMVQENNLLKAIACYRDALTIAPQRLSVVAKIAKCYADLEFYRDCLYISDYLLQQIEEDKESNRLEWYREKSNIYNFLGDIFQKLAVKKNGSDCVKVAFEFYQESLYFNPLDVRVSWKIVELFISVLQEGAIATDEKAYYQERARKAFLDFKGNAEGAPGGAIALEAQKSLANLGSWWEEQLTELKL